MKKVQIFSMLVLGLGLSAQLKAQTDPLMSQYFTNRYIANPAMAGINKGISLNGVYRQLFSGFPGNPTSQSLSLDYGFDKVGLGVNLLNDRSGSMRQTRAVGTFAYHVPLSAGGSRLSFGVSAGLSNQGVSQRDIIGTGGDDQIAKYNNQANFFDGDFGIGYSNKGGLTLQVAAPNLRKLFKSNYKNQSAVSIFYAAASYKIDMKSSEFSLEPIVAYRGFSEMDGVIDAGAQFYLGNEQVFFSALYHSSQSGSFGLGMNLKKRYLISGIYTTSTSYLAGYSNGNFELNLRYALWK